MTSSKEHFFVNDKTGRAYFTAVVLPAAATAVVFPADPNGALLGGWDVAARCEKIASAAAEKGVSIAWEKWKYFEVLPHPEWLTVWKHEFKKARWILARDEVKEERVLAQAPDIAALDALAKEAGLPTIGEYYTRLCEEWKATGSLEDAAHAMISAWTRSWPSPTELLAQLRADERDRMHLVSHYKHGWYYTVTRGDQKGYFRTKNTETLLRAFILQAEDAEKNGESIRFAYCLREYMPEGIDWQPAPA
jgi:hypothetical protein